MKKINVIKDSREFNRIIHSSKYVKNDKFVLYYNKNDLDKYRFGISVGKKIGNAVCRNHYKRIIRNIVDNNKNIYSNSYDYIIIVRKGCLVSSFDEISNALIYLLRKIEKEKLL